MQTEGTGFGAACPSTEVSGSGAVAAPGSDESKRRKVTPQTRIHALFGSTLTALKQIISDENVCINCVSSEHKIDECPSVGASEWRKMLIDVGDGVEARRDFGFRTNADKEMEVTDATPPEVEVRANQEHQAVEPTESELLSKRLNMTSRPEPKTLEEIVGASVMTNVLV